MLVVVELEQLEQALVILALEELTLAETLEHQQPLMA
jgi:hypothetical protein